MRELENKCNDNLSGVSLHIHISHGRRFDFVSHLHSRLVRNVFISCLFLLTQGEVVFTHHFTPSFRVTLQQKNTQSDEQVKKSPAVCVQLLPVGKLCSCSIRKNK